MKREDRKNRVSLTLLFTLCVFVILFVAVVLSFGIVYLLTFLRVLSAYEGNAPDVLPILLFMGLISLLVGSGTAFLVSKIPMGPVNHVIDTLNRLASGDFKARLSFGKGAKRYPVVQEITDSFNAMAGELENTELLRTDFINNFSHEFKTPIVSIAGFAKLLRRGNLPQEQKEEYLAIIEEESLRLAAMATNVMNLTKIENQTILTDITRFNLTEQLRSCVLLLEEKWTRKNIVPDLEFPEHSICANEELLKQVWINLLDNAIKFSPDYGEVTLRIREEADWLYVSVTNYGPDIPPDKLDKIWGKFYQADESHAAQGNGVGLAVVKQVVTLHGGKVSVTSGGGTTVFTVGLPQR